MDGSTIYGVEIMDLQIKKAAEWLQEQINRYPFGEIGIRLIVHDGQIRRIEKTIIEKEQSM